MRREVEDAESGWGEQVRRDWKELGVKDADHWTHLVENRAWLSRQLKRAPSADDDGEIADEGEEDGEEGAEEAEA